MHASWAVARAIAHLTSRSRLHRHGRTRPNIEALHCPPARGRSRLSARARVGVSGAIVLAVVIYVGLVALARVVWVGGRVARVVPRRVLAAVIGELVVVLLFAILNGVAARVLMDGVNSSFAALNQETKAGDEPPTTQLRSGGPASPVTWDSLGRRRCAFVARGPNAEQLSAFNAGRAAGADPGLRRPTPGY